MSKIQINENLKDLDIVENTFGNVKVTKYVVAFGKKINGLRVFELYVDYSAFYDYAFIRLFSREKKDKNVTLRNKVFEINAKTGNYLSDKDLSTIGEQLVKLVLTDENIERMKHIEQTICDRNKPENEEDKIKTLDAALVTLQLEGNFEMFKDAIHKAISGIDNIPTFMVYDNHEEVGIANNFKDVVTVVDRTFKNKFNKTFYELVGIDVYTSRYQLLELLFNKVRIERCNGYMYILK